MEKEEEGITTNTAQNMKLSIKGFSVNVSKSAENFGFGLFF